MILSILIPTLPGRAKLLESLKKHLGDSRYPDVQVITDERVGVSTGRKRNDLITRAAGEYIVFIDDDDMVPADYIESIRHAALKGPDCITFRGHMTTNGKNRVDFVLRLGEMYEERGGKYYRWPNHITPIRRSIALKVPFPDIYVGEDYAWSKQINDMKLIHSEVFIDKEMYHYDFKTNK